MFDYRMRTLTNELIECTICKKEFKLTSILRHISLAKTCKESYPDEDLKELKDNVAKRRKLYKQKLYEANKEKISVYNKAYQEKLKRKQATYDEEHPEAKKQRSQVTKEKNSQYYFQNSDSIRKKQAEYKDAHSESLKEKNAQYNKKHSESIRKKQADYNKEHSETIRQKQAEYNKEHSESIRDKQAEHRDKIRAETHFSNRILRFKRDTIEGPNFICQSCQRALFKKNVKVLDPTQIAKLLEKCKKDYLKEMKLNGYQFFTKLILCHNCHKMIGLGRVPSIHVSNGLQLDPVPDELKKLTELEHQLIQPNLLFMKIKKLPKSRMPATHDKMISVPLDLEDIFDTVTTLPRHPDEAYIVAVKLKRKLELKNAHLSEFIRPEIVIQALLSVIALGNPFFQNIEIDKDFLRIHKDGMIDKQDQDLIPKQNVNSEDKHESDDTESDEDERLEQSKNPVKKYQVKSDEVTCLMPENLETQIVLNKDPSKTKQVNVSNGKTIEIAPGEGKIPTNYLRQQNFDAMSFIRHHPTGKFGLNEPRVYKLSPVMYFNQRLLNRDERFSQDPLYVFMCASYLERLGLERQIDISGLKGTISNGEGKEKEISLKDPYDVFKKIKGTPKYWQLAKNELIAKVKQLGPFHIFFTLSCGEMRWSDVMVSVLRRKGFKIDIPENWSGKDEDLMVNGKPIWEFIEKDLRSTKHELLKDYTFLITRMFDARVKSFISNILMGPGKDKIPISFYSYRIEFQVNLVILTSIWQGLYLCFAFIGRQEECHMCMELLGLKRPG